MRILATTSPPVGTLLIVWLLLITECDASGKISVRFKTYDNSGGKGSNGHCCDGRWIICGSACDHQFSLCLDYQYGSQNMKSCPLGSRETGEMSDQDSITFGSSISGVKNPMVFDVTRLPSSILIKVDVWDVDDNSHDHVDYLNKIVHLGPLKRSGRETTVVFTGRTRLVAGISTKCDPNFYGEACDVFCREGKPGQHFTCDRTTGRKICHEGWTSEYCSVSINDCSAHRCENFATCVDQHLGYKCECPTGFTGQYCEQEVLECASDPCFNNGTCLEGLGTFHCNCTEGWIGSLCEESVDDCWAAPCLNNGTCMDGHNGYNCECMEGWTGENCEIDIDECASGPCIGPATCLDQMGRFECHCASGYSGPFCEIQINECVDTEENLNPCQYNSTCHDTDGSYTCECVPGYTGRNCETNINECAGDVCKNGAICLDFIDAFKCVCVHGYIGETCSERDLCLDNECNENSTCIERLDTYECVCPTGWGGTLCNVELSSCILNACSNNGTCYQEDPETNSQGHFTCICPEDWTGPTCEMPTSLSVQFTPKPPGPNAAEIFVLGDVGSVDEAQVKSDLLTLLSRQMDIEPEHLNIQLQLTRVPAVDPDIEVVRILALVSSNDPETEPKVHDLQMSWQQIPEFIVDRVMTYPVYRGQFEAKQGQNPESAPSVDWARSNWYVILLVVMVAMFLAFIVLVTVNVFRRMKKGRLLVSESDPSANTG
ncbi:fibropellin-1-like [Argonauta hians]